MVHFRRFTIVLGFLYLFPLIVREPVEAGLIEGFGREEPVTLDESAVGGERLEAMGEDVVGVEGEKEVGDKTEVVHVAELVGREAAERDAVGGAVEGHRRGVRH